MKISIVRKLILIMLPYWLPRRFAGRNRRLRRLAGNAECRGHSTPPSPAHCHSQGGGLTATLDSVDQGANDIPVSTISLKDSKLSLTVNDIHGTYEGNVNKEATEITGTWLQGQPLELNFKRAPAQSQPLPPQRHNH